MADPWTYAGSVAQLDSSSGDVTLVDESTFAISGRAGDITPGSAQGLFVLDTRIVSRFEILVNGSPAEPLAAVTDDPFSSTFVSRCPPAGRADSTLMVFRSRHVGQGMREDLTIRNFGDEPSLCTVELFVDADFADLFAVKESRILEPDARGTTEAAVAGPPADGPGSSDPELPLPTGSIVMTHRRGSVTRGTEIRFFSEVRLAADLATFEVIVPPRGEWATCIEVAPVIDGTTIEPRYRCGRPVDRASPPSAWPSGADRFPRSRRTTPGCARWCSGAPRTSEPSGSSIPTTPSGWWWRQERRGS